MYLVAWIYSAEDTTFSEVENQNSIYRCLVNEVYLRRWAKSGRHQSLDRVTHNEFNHVLECIALAVWHGDGRKTTLAGVKRLCGEHVLKKFMEKFQQDRETGIVRLILSFFFKTASEVIDSNPPFEFTHKSFGEYLSARRIVNEVIDSSKKMEVAKEEDKEKERHDALIRLASLCGPTPLDMDLLMWIRDEIALRDKEDRGTAAEGQSYLTGLIGHIMREGMPMHDLAKRPDYPTEVRMARNAVEMMLAVLNACARVSRVCSTVDWPRETSFGNLISRLRGQRKEKDISVCLNSLSYLDLHEQILAGQDLVGADLTQANLDGADLSRANLEWADLSGAYLEEADLLGANLYLATLTSTILKKACLCNADLMAATLDSAHLGGADLQAAHLYQADLIGANLEKADLRQAVLEEARLGAANLTEAVLWKTNLYRADLCGSNFSGANLTEASLQEADLREANLRGADLSGADLRFTENFTQEQLDGAYGDDGTELPKGLKIKRCKHEKSDKNREREDGRHGGNSEDRNTIL